MPLNDISPSAAKCCCHSLHSVFDLLSLKNTLAALDDQQKGTLGLLLKANKARADAQAARDEALKSVSETESTAREAQRVAPDGLTVQTILNRVSDARKAGNNAVASAAKAIEAADQAAQNVEVPGQESSPASEAATGSEGDQANGEQALNAEELLKTARESADEAMKYRDEAKSIAAEVQSLARQTTQEYDNWSVVQSLFSLSDSERSASTYVSSSRPSSAVRPSPPDGDISEFEALV